MERIDRQNMQDVYALTPTQEGMLFYHLKEPAGDLYFEQLSLQISGCLDATVFEQAWNCVIDTNEMLRTVFRWKKMKHPIQAVLTHHDFKIRYHDLAATAAGREDREKLLAGIKTGDRQEKFSLQEVPFRVTVCKMERDRFVMIISNHHILYDGWSNGIIIKEFFNAYNALVRQEVPLKSHKSKFKEYIKWIRSRDKDRQETFWKEYLAGVDTTAAGISIKRVGASAISTAADFSTTLSKQARLKLEDFVRKNRVTMSSLLYTAYGILLKKYNNSNDVIFGTTVSGRSAKIKDIENMVGLFINTLPLRVQSEPDETILALLKKVNDTVRLREEHETTALADIKGYCFPAGANEPFDSILVVENYPLDIDRTRGQGPLTVNSYSTFEMTNYDLAAAIYLSEEIGIHLIYNGALFAPAAIERLARHLTNIIDEILQTPGKKVGEIEMLCTAEREQLLFDFNATQTGYPRHKTIHCLFEEQAGGTPGYIAVVEPGENKQLTYHALNENGDRLAGVLRGKGVTCAAMVPIMGERSLEMIIGILAILKAGGAYLPIDPGYPGERKRFMLKDCRANVLLTQKEYPGLAAYGVQVVNLEGRESYGGERSAANPKTDHAGANSPAYVLYTSGTTGNPKGVAVVHRNVVRLVKNTDYVVFNKADRILQTGPFEFDASTFEMWGALLNGLRLYQASKAEILSVEKLRQIIGKYRITIMWLTSPLFNQISRQDSEPFAGLRYLLVGGDVLSTLHINRVRRRFPALKIINGYGPTENTTFSTTFPVEKEYEGNIPIGKPISNSTVYILDRVGKPLPLWAAGELYVGGDGVAAGYLNNPELTAARFVTAPAITAPAHSQKPQPGSNIPTLPEESMPLGLCPMRLYKTGDLARWLPDGNIEFLGRMDHQVKIRGFRIELGEIENQLVNHDSIKEAVAAAITDKTGEQMLCAYVVPSSPGTLKIEQIRDYLQQTLPDYMIPVHFVTLERLPLTISGKIDRKSLPQPGPISTKPYTAPRSETEVTLANIWAEVLGIDSKQIGIDDNFFELGGSSLKVTGLIGRIHKKLNIEVPFNEIFEAATIKELGRYIGRKHESPYSGILPLEKREYYPLSSAQRRLFVLQQMDAACTAYNICGIMEVEGAVEKEKFETAFRQLIDRHESLRTSFHMIDEIPVQRVHESAAFEIEYHEPVVANRLQVTGNFIRPFDLSHAPLLRVGLIEQAARNYILMVDMHHIISDGTSVNVLLKDFAALYEGEKLPALGIQYKEFAGWQNSREKREKIEAQEAFWLNEFAGEIPILNLPTDYSRPVIQDFSGCTVGFELPAEQVRLLKKLAADTRTTLYMLLLALYNIMLAKISGQTDIVVGTPMALRRSVDLERIVGMFVNTLALRNFLNEEKSFEEFLLEIKERTLDAFTNRDYPYEDLVESAAVERNAGRNPLFDTMFALQKMDTAHLETDRSRIKTDENENNTSKFDLSLIVTEMDENLLFAFEYSTKLFKKETVERFISYFKQTVSAALENRQEKISAIEIITESEIRQILEVFNHPAQEYPPRTVIDCFAEQVEKRPDSTACFDDGNHLTFEEINSRADVLANIIKEL